MKSSNYKTKITLLGISLMVTFAACSAVNNEVESISEQDIELATQIIGESISTDNSGVMNSIYDAVSAVDQNGISYGGSRAKDDGRSGRGRESNYSYSYDAETGTHTIEYNRSVTHGDFSKSVSLLNTYVFTSPDDEFIVSPRANNDSVEAVQFTGSKTGELESRKRNSEFARLDTFSISGLHSTSSIVSIDGTHYGSGTASGMTSDSVEASRQYTINLDFQNIQIDKDSVSTYGNLEQGVTGSLTYSMVLNKTIGEENDEQVVEGTIEFEGDGTALLRFKKIPKIVRFSLKDGSSDEE